MRRTRVRALATAGLMLALSIGGPAVGHSLGATEEHRDARTPAARPGSIVVHGIVTYAGGAPIRHANIDAFNLTADPDPRLLDETRSTRTGAFRLVIDRRPSLAAYAEHHNGRLNVVLWVGKGKRLYVRNERVVYDRGAKSPVEEYRLGRTPMLASQPLRARSVRHGKADGEVVDTHWDTIARVSASRGFTTELKYYRNLETTVDFGIAYDGRLDVSGSMEIGEDSGVSLEPTLRGYAHARAGVQIEIEHRRVTACEWRPWMQIDGRACVDYILAEWSGDFHDTHLPYRGCSTVDDEYQLWKHVGRMAWSVTKTTGKSLTSTWSVAGLVGSVTSSTAFSETNFQRWSVPNQRHTVIAQFCLGGVDGPWKEASEVLTSSRLPDPPCHRERGREPRQC